MHTNFLEITMKLILSTLFYMLLAHSCLGSENLSAIKNSIKNLDFKLAKDSLDAYQLENPDSNDAIIYDFINNFGYFIEEDLPNYLIANLNAKESTKESFNIDEGKNDLDSEYPIVVQGNFLGYWHLHPGHLMQLSGDYFFNDVLNGLRYQVIKAEKSSFVAMAPDLAVDTTQEYYFPNIGQLGNSGISFKYTGLPKQVDFKLYTDGSPSPGYEVVVYINGIESGSISQWGWVIETHSTYLENQFNGGDKTLPLYLRNGDIVSFEVDTYDFSEYNLPVGFETAGEIGIDVDDDYNLEIENGVSYNAYFPELSNLINLQFGFEGDSIPPKITRYPSSANIQIEQNDSHSGDSSLFSSGRINKNAGIGFRPGADGLEIGKTYTISCYAKAVGNNSDQSLELRARVYNYGNREFLTLDSKDAINDEWVYLSYSFIIEDVDYDYDQFFISGPDAGIDILIDDFQFVEAAPEFSVDTIKDLASIFTSEGNLIRDWLEDNIANLNNFDTDGSTTIDTEFSGYSEDIIIEHCDVLTIKSLLQLGNAFLGMLDQYDLPIAFNFEELRTLYESEYSSVKDFLDSYISVLNTIPEKIEDHRDTKLEIENSIEALKTAVTEIWSRDDIDNSTYLIEIEDAAEDDLNETIALLDAFKASLGSYVKAQDLSSGKEDFRGGATVSFKSFLEIDPFPIKDFILDVEEAADDRWQAVSRLSVFKEYGFIEKHLPENFDDMIVVFYDEAGEIVSTTNFKNSSDEIPGIPKQFEFDIIDGELYLYGFSDETGQTIDGHHLVSDDPDVQWGIVTLSYNVENEGAWEFYTDSYDPIQGSSSEQSSGKFIFYPDTWDINQNGIPDTVDFSMVGDQMYDADILRNNTLDYLEILSPQYLAQVNVPPLTPMSSLNGFILVKNTSSHDANAGAGMGTVAEVNVFPHSIYFINKNFHRTEMIEQTHYYPEGESEQEIYLDRSVNYENWSYTYNADGYGATEDNLHSGQNMGSGYSRPRLNTNFQLVFRTPYTGSLIITSEDTTSTRMDTSNFSIYPSFLDLDDDGLDDHTGYLAGISPNFQTLPSQEQIESAITQYNISNPTVPANGMGLLDTDNDGMPDTLEENFGSDRLNPEDANLSLDLLLDNEQIINNKEAFIQNAITNFVNNKSNGYYTEDELVSIREYYTRSQLEDLRPGSTLIEINNNIATLGIVIEHSTNLSEWSILGQPINVELENSNSDVSFYRFSMSEPNQPVIWD